MLVDDHCTDEIVHPPLCRVIDGVGVERDTVKAISVGAIDDADETNDESTEMWLRGLDGERHIIGRERGIGVQTRTGIESFDAIGRERHDQFAA
jgi:hypothetical protein